MGIVLIGAGLRFWGLYWDAPHRLHCDEAALLGATERLGRSLINEHSLNPHFVYGALPLYLDWLGVPPTKLVCGLLGYECSTGDALQIWGRLMSALADIVAIFLVFRLAALHNVTAGLLSAAFYAVALLNVRESHFFTVDTLASCFALWYVILCVRATCTPGWKGWVWCGVALGLCFSTKISSLPLAGLALVAFGVIVWRAAHQEVAAEEPQLGRATVATRISSLMIGAIAIIPAIVWSWQRSRIIGMARGAFFRMTPEWRQATHSTGFWEAQIESIYSGTQHLLVMGALGVVLLMGVVFLATCLKRGPRIAYQLRRHVPQLLVFGGTAVGVFVVLNPYCVLEPRGFWLPSGPMVFTWNMLQGAGAFHPPSGWTIQFIGTKPVLYHFAHVFPYAWGWPLTALLTVGFVWALCALWLGKLNGAALVCVAALISFATTMGPWMKMARYIVPFTPLACALAGIFLGSLIASGRKAVAVTAGVAAGAVWITSFVWCASYVSTYCQTDPRVAAARWLGANVPAERTVALEKDDAWGASSEAMLQQAGDFRVERYNPLRIMHDKFGSQLSETDLREKEEYLREKLGSADCLIITDNNKTRLARFADEFPVISEFYAELFGARTDFQRAATFRRDWRILGHRIDDAGSEPSFRLFDHPTVYVFQRTSTIAEGDEPRVERPE